MMNRFIYFTDESGDPWSLFQRWKTICSDNEFNYIELIHCELFPDRERKCSRDRDRDQD